ncbi:MAG: outer membrane protein OmpA-like peptidoglycan-associated protein [Saprospiraceae bacterium]|jgi:outer membrane protein OmpA-like peptidoglycan-associated protein/tetratricopeptide (TPR) repeat protein
MKKGLTKTGILIGIIMMTTLSISEAQVIKTRKDLDKKSLNNYRKAISEGRNRKYQKSLDLYDKVLKKHPEFIDAQLRKAGMLHNIEEYEMSAVAFEAAIAMAPEYDPQMYYSLAIVQRDMKTYDLAARNFQSFIDRSDDEKRKNRAIDLRDRATFAYEATTNPVPFDPQKVGGDVCSDYSEYVPMMNIEGDRMIFTRRVDGQEDFYIAEVKDGEFIRVAEVEGLNTPQNEGVHTISADGKTMIFTACDRRKTGIGSCDLYYARLDSDYWTIPSNMGKVVNSISWDSQPSLSADGKTLFFSSGRQDGYGGNDIWVTTKTDTSGWAFPTLMPKEINTSGNEESPFIHPDGHTLYFRSDKHIGMGGYDIFYSRFVDSTQSWTPAKNIGYPINTEGSEGALSVSLDGKTAFFASDMAYLNDKSNANLDIYSFQLYPEARPMLTTFVKATITDKETGLPLSANYILEVLTENINPTTGKADSKGTFINSLPTNRSYALFIKMDGYMHHSENFDLNGIQDALNPYIIDISLAKINNGNSTNTTKAEPIILRNIFFESGKAHLKSESNFELNTLTQNLVNNSDIKIQIIGHTDNVGSEVDNQKLSEERAKSVADALILRGIASDRVSYLGLGESLPIADNQTEEGRMTNRRTEFVIK